MFLDSQMGVYVHWPFCASKCPYCDFNSHVRPSVDQNVWLDSYLTALEYFFSHTAEKQVVSVFFGGGTPSLMEPFLVEAIINKIRQRWRISNDLEITLEANPTSVEATKFHAYKEAGVNRLSLGVQSLVIDDLRFLGREHDVDDALKAIRIADQCFDRYSFDLIYARPGQTLDQWADELKRALDLSKGHLSLYQLTIERSTPFYIRHKRGEFQIPDDVRGAEFYHLTSEITSGYGLPAYEVSNHAAYGQECRHNLLYWHGADYIGIGPGAHGRFHMGTQKVATQGHRAPEIWLKQVLLDGHGCHPFEDIDARSCFEENLMMGMRLTRGICLEDIGRRLSLDWEKWFDWHHLKILQDQGWASYENGILVLNTEGLLRLNSILPYLLV